MLTADQLDEVNVLVNNAGTAVVGGIEELTEEQWDLQFSVNVKSVFWSQNSSSL